VHVENTGIYPHNPHNVYGQRMRVLPEGACGEGQVRRSLSVITGLEIDVVVIWVKGWESGNKGAPRLKYAVNKRVMDI